MQLAQGWRHTDVTIQLFATIRQGVLIQSRSAKLELLPNLFIFLFRKFKKSQVREDKDAEMSQLLYIQFTFQFPTQMNCDLDNENISGS